MIGLADLAGAFVGAPGQVEHPQALEAIALVSRHARAAGPSVGIGMGLDAEPATQVARLAVPWILCGGDCSFMIRATDAQPEHPQSAQ